jgi:uncharacterized protein (DUF2062 family)
MWLSKRVADPFIQLVKQGASPAKLSLAVSLGIFIAVVPVFGASTLLCMAVIWAFRLNPVAILLVNQLAYPLQFLLYIPFIRAGEKLFHADPLPLSVESVFALISTDVLAAIELLWRATMYALVAWVALAVPVVALGHLIFKMLFTYVKRTYKI